MATRYNYTGGIVTDGLVLHLDAAKRDSYPGSGTTWYDLSGNGRDGTLTNGPTYSGVSKDSAVVFDGSNDYVSISTYTFGNGNWTLNMWVNIDNFSKAYFMSNISGGPVSNVFGAISNAIYYQNYDGAWQTHNGNTTLSTGTWYMLTWVNYAGATDQNGTMQMYVNGTSDSGIFNSYTTNGGPCNIIAGHYGSTRFDGKISNVAIHSKALTASEIQQNYNALKGRYGL